MQKAHDSTKNNYWENYPSIETPIIAEQLNRIETSVDVIDDRVVAFDLTKANATDLAQTVKNITYNTETGVWVYTWWNGSTLTVDQNIEKIPVSFSMSPQGVITMTTTDGTTYTCDIATLIKTYTFLNSQTIAATDTVDESGNHQITLNVIDGSITESKLQPNFLADCRAAKNAAETAQQNSEAWAVGTKNGVPVGIDDDQYENYAKFYAENSEDNAENSEAWAVGQKNGVDVPNTDPTYHNNSKYWANQARAIVGDKVDSFNTRVGAVIPEKGDYDISQITPVSGAQVGQVPVIRNVGAGQEVELGFVLEAPSSSGHTILNNGGSEMYQRDYLQFKGLSVSDDSTEERTVIEHNINNDAPTFTEASTRANIVSGESISTLFGKIKKWFTDIKDLAFIAKDGTSSTKYLRGDGTWQAFSKSTVGLGNVDNTSDADKPVSTAQQTALNAKVNKSGDTISGNLTLDKHSGTTSSLSTSDLILGNNIPQGTAGNSIGRIDIYGYNQYRTRLYAVNQTAHRNIELPDSSGTVAIAEKTNCRLSEVLTFTNGKRQLNLSQLTGKSIKTLISVYANGDIPVHFYMLDSQYNNFQIMIILDGNYSTYSGDVSMSIIYDEK